MRPESFFSGSINPGESAGQLLCLVDHLPSLAILAGFDRVDPDSISQEGRMGRICRLRHRTLSISGTRRGGRQPPIHTAEPNRRFLIHLEE